MGRDRVTLQAPSVSLDGFLSKYVRKGTRWHRAHRRTLGAWFYASGMEGRFDLPAPDGTCYVANTAEVAARELIGPDFIEQGIVSDSFLDDRVVSQIILPTEANCAKTTDKDAFKFRLSNEISSTADYELTQGWAKSFRAAGFTGIWYQPRYSPDKGRALALFGPGGVMDVECLDRRELREVVAEMIKLDVVSTSLASAYEILDEPLE
ncbi:RES domain-containing protein [Brevibacterium sp. 50QC2O2]|uniref:RES family NAD+ phosphorylase n=1 Tax=Brevibacterium sp. 50QC2O2 TaxID=2968459 RepID=UPI00211C6FEB|nr:RES family NAD+ phosphorylase [Brevibacterium sp. 50QC2O2]MCQ9388629.1 RES domain-containing protein [Brevibacterium sp. 50QC2O2]